ncbi:hypothetical protein [Cerasicoccus frondis]|uniref:hypothetical protein n=1 Tax=Cerasicoccus frondis TaxID=490090 RepID=UPI0028528776|nr:hypothetical protein [Cerasicoccus frondis]
MMALRFVKIGGFLIACILVGGGLWYWTQSEVGSKSGIEPESTKMDLADATTATPVMDEALPTDPALIELPILTSAEALSKEEAPLINERLQSVMDSTLSYLHRLDQLQELDLALLGEQDFAAIREFLTTASPETSNPSEDFAIRNDLLEMLMRQPGHEDFIQGVLIDGVKDTAQHTLWREYLLQHYSLWVDDAVAAEYRYDAELAPLLDVLKQSLSESDNEIAGAAILNYLRLHENHPELISDTDFRSVATQIVTDPNANRATRISAILALSAETPTIAADQLQLMMADPVEHTLLKVTIYHFARRAVENGNLEYQAVLKAAKNLNSPILSRLSSNE